jgi:hypothetical protein
MEERRRHQRYKTLRSAKIRFNGGFVTDCTIRDLSTNGACLETADAAALPSSFELLLGADGSSRFCTVAWKSATHLAVSFSEDV